MLISQRLEMLVNGYEDSRRTVALYLLTQGERAQESSMGQIADDTSTSKATLVRVAKTLGYSGWREFFDAWRHEYDQQLEKTRGVDHSIPFTGADGTQKVMESVGRVVSDSAWQTTQIQDPSDVDHAARILLESHRIGLFGISVNALCLQLFQRKMLQIGVDTVLPPQSEMGLFERTLTSSDCVIAASYTGENKNRSPMKYLPHLRERGVRIIGITSEGDNFLRNNSDVTLTLLAQENLYAKIGTFSSESSLNTVLDILYARYFSSDYARNLDFKSSSSKTVEVNRRPS